MSRVRKSLFPAAGYGTRFLPATKSVPKEMLPVKDRPLIHYGVEEAIDAGLTDVNIILGRGKGAIEDYFDKNYELETELQNKPKKLKLLEPINSLIQKGTFTFRRQGAMRGLGDAIFKAKSMIGDEPFGVVLADDICDNPSGDGVMKQMVDIYEKYQCAIVAVMEVPQEKTESYGVIAGDEVEDGIFRVSNMVEKPKPEEAPSNLAIIGRYILIPEIFDILEKTEPGAGGEIQVTDALQELAKDGKVIAYKFKGKRFDCGSVDGYMEAMNYFYNKK
ncbi:MAG TPA: UTP--glucose-1-phosphate uridylyltransferase GalU [Campylobacterales bacterium]|nr:UTP--glucose-1-phosphate uridylyltransferase GalU [Campylobacterales bacterium]